MIHPDGKPSLEDLLRLKRAERPAPEFWGEFERELRAKQLAALVARKPWWRTLPNRLRGLAKYRLPLGATAVLAVTLLSIRNYQPVQPPREAVITDPAGRPAEQAAREAVFHSEAPAAEPQHRAVAARNVAPAPKPALSSEANAPGELARMVPMLSADESRPAAISPSVRSIAENRVAAEVMLGTGSPAFETRPLARKTPPEPLAQITYPSEMRRSRFAVAFAASIEAPPPTASTARVARRLSDEQLYDTIRRFGASGNSVSFRF